MDINHLACQWPSCSHTRQENVSFQGRSALEAHYRSAHSVHEFSWSCLLGDGVSPISPSNLHADKCDPNSEQPLSSDHLNVQTVQDLRFTLLRSQSGASVSFGMGDTSRNKRSRHSSYPTTNRYSFSPKTTESANLESPKPNNILPKHSNRKEGGGRFSLLPSDKRPEPTNPLHEVAIEPDPYCFISPEPLDAPDVGKKPSTTAGTTTSIPTREGEYQLPKSSLAPSYILASTNRFTRSEVATFVRDRGIARLRRPPLFVYGSFMFPSILSQRAKRYVSDVGFYSESSQRRVKSNADDWANVNVSLQHAAEQMTPAVLTGYERWRPSNLSCAAICECSSTPSMEGKTKMSSTQKGISEGEVQGFLIFGLAEDALKCCDELFCSSSSLKDAYSKTRSDFEIPSNFFSRKMVNVRFSLKGGEMRSIDATTYVYSLLSGTTKRRRWDINDFVRSRSFHRLLLINEEKKLAQIMGITFVLPGDALSDAVSRQKVEHVIELLEQGHDVNAPCQAYGSALQAASAQRSEEIVSLLLEYGAEVNATGGQYDSALIAATVHGHEAIARKLIKAGANVMKDAGLYISPLYQAVSYSDIDMVFLLLEHGAWLGRNYGEVLDLASERGNEEMVDLLLEYDVRDLRLKLPAPNRGESGFDSDQSSDGDLDSDKRRRQSSSRKKQVTVQPTKVVRAVAWKALILKGSRGKWTGIKGVKILRTAINAGVSPQILDDIAPHLATIRVGLEFLKQAIIGYADEQRSPMRQRRRGITPNYTLGTVEELSDDFEGDEDPANGQGHEQPPSRRVHFGPEPQVTTLPSEPTTGHQRPVASSPRDSDGYTLSPVEGYSAKAVCPSCEGRGGRRGTGNSCSKCHSTGRYKNTRCNICKGAGQLFSERNTCRTCNGGRSVYTSEGTVSEPRADSDDQRGQTSSSFPAHSQPRGGKSAPRPSRSRRRGHSSASLPSSSRRTESRQRTETPYSSASNQTGEPHDPPPPYSSQKHVHDRRHT